jgi:hypothetical protein
MFRRLPFLYLKKPMTTDSAVTEDGGTPWYAEADNDSPLANVQLASDTLHESKSVARLRRCFSHQFAGKQAPESTT